MCALVGQLSAISEEEKENLVVLLAVQVPQVLDWRWNQQKDVFCFVSGQEKNRALQSRWPLKMRLSSTLLLLVGFIFTFLAIWQFIGSVCGEQPPSLTTTTPPSLPLNSL